MKRLLVLILLMALPGCVGFEEYQYEEFSQQPAASSSCGCQTSPVSAATAAPGYVSQLPSIQTREPDLAQTKR